jgi:hypothetical protein
MRYFLLALLWLPAGANTSPVNPEQLSRDHLAVQMRMDAAGRIIEPRLGTQQTFWVRVPNDTFGLTYQYAQKSATLQRKGSHCYLFVEDGTQAPDSVLDGLQGTYDTLIYPTCRRFFGEMWNPGIDGDSLVTILLSSSLHMEFYFSPFDEMADSLAQTKRHHSNEREMFYLRPGENLDRMKATMAHCEEHLIHWWQNPPGEAWLDEACAMYAMDLCGYGNMISEIYDFQVNSGLNLAVWPSGIVDLPLHPPGRLPPHEPMSAKWGEQYAFLAYLSDNFPGRNPSDPMIYHLVARRALGDTVFFEPYGYMSVAKALYETGGPPSFVEPYLRWTVANFVNDTLLRDSTPGYPPRPFGYRKPLGGIPGFVLPPTNNITTFPDSLFLEISWNGQQYVSIEAGKPDLTVEVDQDTAIWYSHGRNTGFVYRGYIVSSTTEDFAPGSNALSPFPYPTSRSGFSVNLKSDVKRVKIIPSLPLALNGGPPKFYIYAYTPFNPKDTTISRSAYVYPNPFNPDREKTHFRYVLSEASVVDIRVYDAAGNQLTVIANQQETPPGIYNSQAWDGRNYRGMPVANGVYFGRMKIGKATTGVKIVVMR